MIKVLQITNSLNNDGIASFLMNYYEKIDKNRIQFDFVTCNHGEEKYTQKIKNFGVKIYELPQKSKKPFSYLFNLTKIIKNNNYNIVHIHANSASMFVESVAAKLADSKHIIGHSHNTRCNVLWQHYFLKPFVNLFFNERLACSKEAGTWVFGNRECKIINNAIDMDIYKYDEEIRLKTRDTININNEFVLGFVGRMYDKQKNIKKIIDVFEYIVNKRNNSRLILVGDGKDSDMLKQYAKEKGVRDKIDFLGTRSDINDLLNCMDCFIMPSNYEGLSISLIEAQATGLKCVVSNIVPFANINGKVYSVDLNESNDYWAEVCLKDNKISRIDASKKVVESDYNIKIAVKKIEQFYLDMK